MSVILAKDATIGELYHSPKGIPCEIISISDSSATVKSLITMKEIIIPLDLPMVPYLETIEKEKYANKTVKKSD